MNKILVKIMLIIACGSQLHASINVQNLTDQTVHITAHMGQSHIIRPMGPQKTIYFKQQPQSIHVIGQSTSAQLSPLQGKNYKIDSSNKQIIIHE